MQLGQSNELFDRWCGYKSNNKKVTPVELLVLGSLRYLGRGWTFDDIEESTAIDNEVHCRFFKVFIQLGSTALYQKLVITPFDLPTANANMYEYSQAGFPGCVGSCDCTHIVTKWCEYNLKNNHLGAKNSLATRTFNLTCNRHRRILHTTNGGPGRWNDQSMARLVTPAGILRIPVFSVPVALFSQESRFLFRRNFFGTPSGILSVWGLRRMIRRK